MYRLQRFIPPGKYLAVMYCQVNRPGVLQPIDAYEVYKASDDINELRKHYPSCFIMEREEYFNLELK